MVVLAGTLTGVAFANSNQTNKPDLSAVYQSFVSKFAANLGVSQDKVTEALETTKKQMLDEAVQQGRLTQEQADKIAANKDLGFGGLGFGHSRDHNFMGKGRNLDSIANVLGITADQLKTDFESGKKIQDIVTEHGMTMDQFNQKMMELKKDAISKAVTDGKLTQEQANKFMEKMEQRFNDATPGNTSN
jgi:polyhydroxyalkanoate synthesis regulator phasin